VTDPAAARHRVVLVAGTRDAARRGGCCSGDVRPFDEGGQAHRHRPVDGTAALYLALRQALPDDVAVEVVAPTNWAWLLPALLADGRRRELRGRALLGFVRTGLRVSSVLVDGVPVEAEDHGATVAAVRAALASSATAGPELPSGATAA
jgi:hypothetical protein